MTDPRLEQAITAAKTGQLDQARTLLSQIVREQPDSETAWLWLAAVLQEKEQRLYALQQVLRINPANKQAQLGLAELQPAATTEPTLSLDTPPPAPTSPPPEAPAEATRPCPACGYPNKLNARFCAACGSPLQPEAAPAGTGTPPAARPRVSQCEMIIGFLVPHRCENPALAQCQTCGRTYCDEHLTVTAQGTICAACQQGLDRPVALPATAAAYNDSDLLLFASSSTWDDDYDNDDTFSDLS